MSPLPPFGDFTRGSLTKEQIEVLKKRWKLISWAAALNQPESIAAAYVTGVADERTGFRIIGLTYCESVESDCDVIAWARGESTMAYW